MTLRSLPRREESRRGAAAGRAAPLTGAGRLLVGEEAQGGSESRPTPRHWEGGDGAGGAGPYTRRCLEQAQLLGRLPGFRRCLGRRGWRFRRGGRRWCRSRRRHRGRLVVRLGCSLGLLALANARGDGLCDRDREAWGSSLWSGIQGMRSLEG